MRGSILRRVDTVTVSVNSSIESARALLLALICRLLSEKRLSFSAVLYLVSIPTHIQHSIQSVSVTVQSLRCSAQNSGPAAERQWSSHKVDKYGCTSRGPLHLMVVHAVVQWLASLCRGCRRRAIARSTSHSACNSTCCEWLCLRLFKPLKLSLGGIRHPRRTIQVI